jgi:hypothetical protein
MPMRYREKVLASRGGLARAAEKSGRDSKCWTEAETVEKAWAAKDFTSD